MQDGLPDTDLDVTTGLQASPERVTFLERFFEDINDEVAATYTYTEARADGELVGVAATAHPKDASHVKLAFMHVAEDHQREGVAQNLVDAIRENADRQTILAKAHVAWLKANKFYQSNGWEQDADRSTGLLTAYVIDSA